MKKLLLIIALLISALGLNAQDATFGDLEFTVTSETPAECGVSGHSGKPTDVTIPSTVTISGKEYTVTSIGENAFRNCSSLTSIEIPNSVTFIGESAFWGCSSLTSIEIPNSVTSIGYGAFEGCKSLTSIEIPNSVTSIGDEAFWGCSSLTSIEIPNSVTSIGYGAFYYSSLTSIVVDEDNTVYDSRNNCNAIIETASNTLIVGCMNTAIPNSVTSIGDGAFESCSSLTSIAIPNSVTSIGDMAFYGCSSLTIIEIPNSVTSIGDWAFEECESLTSIEIPNSVTSIGDGAFGGCSSLTSIEIPNSVTSIGDVAFYYCSSLTIIEIPNSVTSIGDWAFEECESLTSIEIPNSVTSIGDGAFRWCESLTSVFCFAEDVPATGEDVFYGCPYNMVIYVPKNSVNAYESTSPWNLYTIIGIDPIVTYNVTAIASPEEAGIITGDGNYNHGEEVILTVTPNEPYKFVNWTENGEVVSEDAEYSFVIENDRNLVANFEKKEVVVTVTYNVTTTVNPEKVGVVIGSGVYNEGDNVVLTAIPIKNGYEFVNWTEDGVVVSEDAQYSFVVTSDRNLVANFEKKEVTSVVYNIATTVNPENVGVVIGSGVYYEGDNVILTAIPIKNGYEFVNWTEDGKVVSEDAQYSFVATSDRELVANFVLLEYYVTAALSSAEAGEITGDGNYNHGEEVTLTATAHEGYKFVNWTENGVVVSEDAEYSFVILKNRNLVANFSSEDIALNVVATAIDDNTIKVEWNAVESAESYNVYRASLTRNSEYEFIANVKETSFTDTGLDANTKYFYSVTAVYADGSESEKSESAEATTKPESIEELSLAFNIYPNPVNDKLYIETEVEIEEVSIFDIYGRRQELSAVSCQPSAIDVSNLNSGVYFVKVVTENGETVKRFIKK